MKVDAVVDLTQILLSTMKLPTVIIDETIFFVRHYRISIQIRVTRAQEWSQLPVVLHAGSSNTLPVSMETLWSRDLRSRNLFQIFQKC